MAAATPPLVVVLLVVAALVRLSHLFFVQIDLPIIGTGSGGLFLAFASAIAENGYRLPPLIPHYTDGGIPFAYPPLSFYLEAVLVYALGIPGHLVVNALPPLLSLTAVAFFYVLTGALNLRPEVRLLALFAFAVSEAAVSAQMEAGGLAEATGTLVLICLAIGLARVRDKGSTGRWHVLAGAALGLCVTASPGSAYGSIVLFVLFAAWQVVSRRGARGETLVGMLLIATTGFVVSAFYVIPVLGNHGFGVLLETFANQHSSPVRRILVVFSDLSQFTVLWDLRQGFFMNAAVAFGILHEIVRRRWWMAVWLVVWLVIPREGGWMVAIPGCIIAGVGIRWLLCIWFERLTADGRRVEAVVLSAASLVCLAALGLAGAGYVVAQEADREYAPDGFAEVLARASSTLPQEARVIALIGDEDWSPFLIRRDVLNMRYGAEWQPGEEATIKSFTSELTNCRTFDCVHSLAVDKFGYQELYFTTTHEVLLDMCGISDRRGRVQRCRDR